MLTSAANGLYCLQILTMKTIAEQSTQGRAMVSDGAWGTLMHQRGLQPGDCPELWCVDRRDIVLEIAKGYIAAGSDMIQTNSFGANRLKLRNFGLETRVAEFNEKAASISREAAGDSRHVIASIGPSGKMLMMGDTDEEALYEAFSEQAKALERGGADACCIETMSALDEAALAVKAAKDNTGLEIICTFTFEKTIQGEYRTMMGVSPSQMAPTMINAGAHIIGANCGNGMEQMADIVKELRSTLPEIPILVHANAGVPVNVKGVTTFHETPEMMAALTVNVVKAGANVVGGCCGTTPDHIREMINVLKKNFLS
jgi:5-methyltetrahydrofolate--homocysteine methyltransferase